MGFGNPNGNAEILPAEAKPSFDRVKKQFLMVFLANLLTFSHGSNVGWFSPALPILTSDRTSLLDGPFSQETVGLIGSLVPIGAIFGGLGFGLVANWIGYKRAMQISSIPMIISWLFIIFAKYSWQIGFSRFLSGLTGGALYTCLPQFVAQIASDRIRGQLNSYIQIAVFSGILAGFIFGSYVSYEVNPILMISITVIYFIAFFWIPESPQFLIRKKKIEEAEKSLRFYRNVKITDTKQNNESISKEFEKFISIAKQNDQQPPITISDFVSPIALRAIIISPFLMVINQFTGSYAITNYAETIFQSTGSPVDPQMSSIVMASVQVIGNYTASQLMDKVGRKVLLLASLSGCFVTHIITGTYTYLSKNEYDVNAFNWVPVVSISLFIFAASIGIVPVPIVLLSEVIPQRIRRIATTFCTSVTFIFQMIIMLLTPILVQHIDLYGSLWLFAFVSAVGLIFTIFVVKETKGNNLDLLEVKTT